VTTLVAGQQAKQKTTKNERDFKKKFKICHRHFYTNHRAFFAGYIGYCERLDEKIIIQPRT